MPIALIIESDTMWRYSMGRALASVPKVDIAIAFDVDEAVQLLDLEIPKLIVADLDVGMDDPDARSTIELLDEIDARQVKVPIVFTSRDPWKHGDKIPSRSDIIVKQKPFSISRLRDALATRLGTTSGTYDQVPFGVVDYVQLACSERYSVAIELETSDLRGRIQIVDGELWSAQTTDGVLGEAAFFRAVKGNPMTRCEPLVSPRGQRNIETPWQMLLMEHARRIDEGELQA